MDIRTNMIAGWTLAASGAALGLAIIGSMVYGGERPEKMGYAIEGVEAEGGASAEAQVPIATLLASADPAKGADVFKKCSACHTINAGGASGIGPNLHGIMGQPIAAKPGFGYSDALKGVGGTWDWEKMSAWLLSPRKFAPGTKMTFAGIGNGQDRANVLAYLNQQGSNLPLPAAPPPGAEASPTGAVDPKAQEAIANATANPTAEIANTGTPTEAAPSLDPAAQEKGARADQ
ncbi:c-type cytochrome [Sphingomonas lenta]|uniref:Cytochrome c family protein n=1 Tax=Sphingomonas lenta TaxID=1141887 RepID=A0A2A2SCY3_9SPHN|nr:cytochrome c family protein [Sphingomonas lenta]PAX07073.1 cytochrome c family protein [Sphingomonas lenta]